MSGVQRFAREIVSALDSRLAAPTSDPDIRYVLLVPSDARMDLNLTSIDVKVIAPFRGHFWEQISLAWASRGETLLSLGNSGPLLHKNHLVVIHDAAVFRHGSFFSRIYGLVHRFLGRILARTARIITVSQFSRKELAEVLDIAEDKILVVQNGSEHLARVVPHREPLKALGIPQVRYFLAIGNITPNKNLKTIIAALNRIEAQDICLVVVGSIDRRVFGQIVGHHDSRVRLVGPQSDEIVAGLLVGATALVFAGIYEGFGIPPLEGLAYGCPVIASDIPAVREVCGQAVDYFSPRDSMALTELMARHLGGTPDRETRSSSGKDRAAMFNWSTSAERLEQGLLEQTVLRHVRRNQSSPQARKIEC